MNASHDDSGNEPRLFGKRKVPVSELTDAELVQEVHARRRRHDPAPTTEPERAGGATAPVTPPRQVQQWLANLELSATAGLADVERAYDRLRARYGPAAEEDDPKRRAAARSLLDSLKRAHEGLQIHFTRRR